MEKDTISLDIQMDDFDVKYLKDIPTSSIGGDVTNNIDLMFCVSYKTIGEVTNHHTGGILSITSNGPEVIKRGQSLSLGSLKLTRPDFGPRNFAD